MSDSLTFVRELTGWIGHACLVCHESGTFYIVSTIPDPKDPFSVETTAFGATPAGDPIKTGRYMLPNVGGTEVGGRGVTRDEAIGQLAAYLARDTSPRSAPAVRCETDAHTGPGMPVELYRACRVATRANIP